MNRSIRGEKIFFDNKAGAYFMMLLEEKIGLLKQRILAYCLMDSHYHLIMQNTSGRLSDFMRQLNGQYGMYFRKRVGGAGYVFQSRFKSTLIQEDRYLEMAIIYVLLNPVRKKLVASPWDYEWSSVREYFTGRDSSLVDNRFVEELFQTEINLKQRLTEWANIELPVSDTRMGEVIGDSAFIDFAVRKFNRRKGAETSDKVTMDDRKFQDVAQVIEHFEISKGIKIDEIDIGNHQGKALRAELLVLLKDKAGLKYSDIVASPLYSSLKYSSLGKLYRRAKDGTY